MRKPVAVAILALAFAPAVADAQTAHGRWRISEMVEDDDERAFVLVDDLAIPTPDPDRVDYRTLLVFEKPANPERKRDYAALEIVRRVDCDGFAVETLNLIGWTRDGQVVPVRRSAVPPEFDTRTGDDTPCDGQLARQPVIDAATPFAEAALRFGARDAVTRSLDSKGWALLQKLGNTRAYVDRASVATDAAGRRAVTLATLDGIDEDWVRFDYSRIRIDCVARTAIELYRESIDSDAERRDGGVWQANAGGYQIGSVSGRLAAAVCGGIWPTGERSTIDAISKALMAEEAKREGR